MVRWILKIRWAPERGVGAHKQSCSGRWRVLAFLRKTVILYSYIFAQCKLFSASARPFPAFSDAFGGCPPVFPFLYWSSMTVSGQHRTLADFRRQRARMVRRLEAQGITDEAVLAAMRSVRRHCFVPEALQARAYEEHPLPIGFGQTISQPYIVAYMSQLLEAKAGMTVLEIGTGSGYQTAVLREMGLEVCTVERVRELHFAARELFAALDISGIRMRLGDGTLGWKEQSPFNRIIVTAGRGLLPLPF